MAQEFNTHGGYFAPAGYFRINEGGSHEENPNGGVQIGMDGQGIPNMLEQEESVYNDYVYSDNITAKPDILKRFFIPYKYGGKLYSEIADALIEEAEERPLDHTSNNGVRAMLTRLADAQETQKQEEEQAKLEEELANMTPEQIAELEQMLAQDEAMQQQQPIPQEAIVPEAMMQPEMQPAMMACGGLLHSYEDGTPGEIVQTVPLDYVPETGNVRGGARMYAEQPFGPAPDTGHITQYVDTRTPVRKAIDNIVDSTPSLRHAKEGFDRFDDTLLGGASQLLVPSTDGVASAGLIGRFGKIIGGGRGLAKVAKGEAKLGKVSERVGEAIGKYGDDLVASTSEAAKAASNTASKSEAALQTIRSSRSASKAERAAAESQIRDIAKEIENTTNPEEIKVYNELLDEMVTKFDKADSALKNSLFESIGKRFSAVKDKAEKGVSSLNEKVAKTMFNGSGKIDKAKKTATKLNPKVKKALEWGAGLAAGSALVGGVAKGVDIAQSSNSEEFAVDPFAYGGLIHRFVEGGEEDRSGQVTGALQIQSAGSPLWIDLAHQGYYGPYAPGQSPQELAAAGNTGGGNPLKSAGASRPVAPAKTRGPIDKIAADTALIGPQKDWRINTNKYKRVPFTKDYIPDGDYSTNGLANPNYKSPTINSGTEQGGADVPIYSTLLEYAHPLYSLFSAGVNMFQQPDKYKFQRARPRIPYMSIPSIIDPEYRAIDVNRTVNDISAAGAGNVRAALDSGAGPSVGTLLTALDNQMTSNMGNARESVAQFNNNAYNTVVGQRNQNAFQRAQLMFELARARANAEAAADTQNIAMDMREQMMNNQAEQQWADAVGAPLDAFTGDLSKMGLRNQNLNAANAASVFGYWRAPDGTVWYNGQPVVNQSSCGGTLLKAIK